MSDAGKDVWDMAVPIILIGIISGLAVFVASRYFPGVLKEGTA